MKKLATATALTLIILNTGLAHQPQAAQNPGSPKPMIGKSRTVTKKESVLRDVRLPPKPKLLRSNPYRFAAIRLTDADPWAVPDDEDMITDRHRVRVVREFDWDADVSDEVAVRLAVARARALAKYRETWS